MAGAATGETGIRPGPPGGASGSTAADVVIAGSHALNATDIIALREQLVAGSVPDDAVEQIDLLRALEELKAAATAAQTGVASAFEAATRADEARAQVPARRRGKDVAAQVGLALRESPAHARSFLSAARIWHAEMPHTLAALRAGRLSGWRAMILVRETAHLPLAERAAIDAEPCARPETLEGVGTRAMTGWARKRAGELDPASTAARARRAAAERSVSIRPAPDTMAYVTALLPVAQGVGVFAALRRAVDTARATGDARTEGQVMADTLVERLTGQNQADIVPLTVNLAISDAALLGAGHEPGLVLDAAGSAAGGAGLVPAQVARELVAGALDADAARLRRIYAARDGDLVAASSTRRFFADGLASLLRVRDRGLCRTPYCDAPIRHLDHVVTVADSGATDLDNGQGLCAACNLAKNSAGLRQRVDEGATGRHTVVTTTSTGHRYRSTAPPPPVPIDLRRRSCGDPPQTSTETLIIEFLADAA